MNGISCTIVSIKNYLDKDKGPGVHREVCIDRMEFNADGTIQRVKVSK